ncbi:MAG: hypothetical protein JNL11_10830 [Bdellovibrionaceae bacterium]|nr:hypothetical protein [Pseudobdellovibrionaceae bacterium]
MTPTKLLELIYKILKAIEAAIRLKRIKDLKDAKNTALNEHDQRHLEKALGGSSGPSSADKYPGMYTRPSKRKAKE